MQVCKYASMQVCKYASMQVCKYASMQVCKYASMQVCKYASMKVCKYASMQVCKYASMQVWKYGSMQVCKYASRQVFKYASMKVRKYASMHCQKQVSDIHSVILEFIVIINYLSEGRLNNLQWIVCIFKVHVNYCCFCSFGRPNFFLLHWYHNIFTTSVSVRKGRGQHAVIKGVWGMTNGPIRAKQVSCSSSVIGHRDELPSTTCWWKPGRENSQ